MTKPSPKTPAEGLDAGRDPSGKFVQGNRAALKHGAYAEDRDQLPEEQQAVLGDLDAEFRTPLEVDQGGRAEMTVLRAGYIGRLTEAEALCRLLGWDLRKHGIFTRKGRVRSTFNAYLQAVATWDRLAQRVGMERRQKDVFDLPLDEYVTTQVVKTEGGAEGNESEPEADTGRTEQEQTTDRNGR